MVLEESPSKGGGIRYSGGFKKSWVIWRREKSWEKGDVRLNRVTVKKGGKTHEEDFRGDLSA